MYLLLFFQILVEHDELEWKDREWMHVYKDKFHLFLLEENLVLAQRGSPQSVSGHLQPALAFKSLVDNVGLTANAKKPVEFLADLKLDFQDPAKLRPFRRWDASVPGLVLNASIEAKVLRK